MELLLDSYPLIVLPELAVAVGLNEAIILQQIHYWTETNKKANKNFRDGYYWTYNTYEEWQGQFPFWAKNTIVRTIEKLNKSGLIFTGNYNKSKIDRTKWYRVNYEELNKKLPFTQNGYMQIPKMGRTIPETISETKSNITIVQNSNKFMHESVSYIKKDTIYSRLSERFYVDDIKSILSIVNQYIDKIYKSKTGREHDKINKPHRMTFVEKLLDFKHETGLVTSDLIDLLNHIIKNINVDDPTIYWFTSPTVLGYWILNFFDDVYYDDLRSTIYCPVETYY